MQTALCAVIIALFLILTEYADSRKEMVKEMADLIDREALKEALLERGFYPAIVKGVLESAQTVDAVEVVRCKDCIGKSTWYNDAEYGCVICGMSGMYPKGTFDFCSYGERRKK